MAINNTYVLQVDLKRQMTSRVPSFRKGDNAILIFRVFDDGVQYNIDSANRAELYHRTSNGNVIKSDCEFINYEGSRAIRYIYEEDAMSEIGRNETLLVVYENEAPISIQPFPVIIYDDLRGGASSFVELLKSLQKQINDLILDLNQTIKLSEKGVPNGVATLDSTGRIPLSQMPPQIEYFKKHVYETVWKNQVHGLRIDDDGILQYDTGSGDYQNVGFSPTAVGGGGDVVHLLDVEISKANSVVTFTYKGSPTVQLQKWDYGDYSKSHFVVNGNEFTGDSITVDKIGLYTLYYKDSNGLEYTRLFNINSSDLLTPTVTVKVYNGDVTVNISTDTSIKKWAKGKQTIGYFQSQGNVFTGNTFIVTEVGWYTIYYKTNNDVERIHEFEVTELDLPINKFISISEMNNGEEFTFGGKRWILLDNTTGYSYCKDSVYNGVFSGNPHGVNIDLSDEGNIGYQLNTVFYNTLKMFEKDLIENKSWSISSYVEGSYPTYTVNMKIGMLSVSEWFKYAKSSSSSNEKYIDNPSTETWLINPYSYTPEDSISSSIFIKQDGSLGVMSPTYPYPSARPTIYLNIDTRVDENGVVTEEIQDIKKSY